MAFSVPSPAERTEGVGRPKGKYAVMKKGTWWGFNMKGEIGNEWVNNMKPTANKAAQIDWQVSHYPLWYKYNADNGTIKLKIKIR